MKHKHIVAPSLLAADFTRIAEEVDMVNQSKADWLHLDVMDGHFVPNITFGMFVIEAIARVSSKPLDVHLMIENPEKFVRAFRDSGADHITVHIEACKHLHRVVQEIKSTGALAGVALNPHTSVDLLEDIIPEVDLICVMSVNPGFGGQKFIETTYNKLQKLRGLMNKNHVDPWVEVDGGVDLGNHEKLLQCGANVLVAGSSIFKANDPPAVIGKMKSADYKTVMT